MKLNAEQAFNAVSLEERIALVAKSQGAGVSAMCVAFIATIPVAYGFNNIYLLAIGAAFCSLLYQAFCSRAWRQEKPKLVLEYLAARTAGRRFAFMYNIKELEVQFVLRGKAKILSNDPNKTQISLPGISSVLTEKPKDVWICLLEGGVTVFSESAGGARLEFATKLGRNNILTTREDEGLGKVVTLTGDGVSAGHGIEISSPFPASTYVFEKKAIKIIEDAKEYYQKAIGMVSNG